MQPIEIPTRPAAQIQIPVQFSRLRDIAYNLWWTWSPEAHTLFHMVDPARWVHYRNPIQLLIDMEPDRWHSLQNNPEFIRAYRSAPPAHGVSREHGMCECSATHSDSNPRSSAARPSSLGWIA